MYSYKEQPSGWLPAMGLYDARKEFYTMIITARCLLCIELSTRSKLLNAGNLIFLSTFVLNVGPECSTSIITKTSKYKKTTVDEYL